MARWVLFLAQQLPLSAAWVIVKVGISLHCSAASHVFDLLLTFPYRLPPLSSSCHATACQDAALAQHGAGVHLPVL